MSPAAPECHLLAVGSHRRPGRNITCPISSLNVKGLPSDYIGAGGSVETPQRKTGRDNAITMLHDSWKSR